VRLCIVNWVTIEHELSDPVMYWGLDGGMVAREDFKNCRLEDL
jgi:hypothetical protein